MAVMIGDAKLASEFADDMLGKYDKSYTFMLCICGTNIDIFTT